MLEMRWDFIAITKNFKNGRQMALYMIRKTIISITNYDKGKTTFFLTNGHPVERHSSTNNGN